MTGSERIAEVKYSRNLEKEAEVVADYLPANYRVEIVSDRLLIRGTDDHGWTLDGYVIPRLASGLIVAQEIYDGS